MRRLNPHFVLLLPLLALLGGAPAAAAPLPPEALPGTGSSLTWDGSQHLGADRRGNVFLLRSETLQVYPVPKGELGEPRRLETSQATRASVRDAAMGDGPGDWLVRTGFFVLRFEDGKDARLDEIPWKPHSVALYRGEPLVGVLPFDHRKAAPGFEGERPLPLLVRFDGSDWSAHVEEPFADTGSEDLRLRTNDLVAQRAVEMAADRSGKLWIANSYVYRLRRFSPAGRLLDEVQVGTGKPETGNQAAADDKLAAHLRRRGVRLTAVGAFTARRVIHALAPARDGNVYLLVSEGGGARTLSLDRYDPFRAALERVPLTLADDGELLGMVAGRDGLYLASWSGRGGRWRIPWEALDTADWKAVPGAEVQGAMAADAEPEP